MVSLRSTLPVGALILPVVEKVYFVIRLRGCGVLSCVLYGTVVCQVYCGPPCRLATRFAHTRHSRPYSTFKTYSIIQHMRDIRAHTAHARYTHSYSSCKMCTLIPLIQDIHAHTAYTRHTKHTRSYDTYTTHMLLQYIHAHTAHTRHAASTT